MPSQIASQLILDERFDGEQLDPRLEWSNPPEESVIDRRSPALVVKTRAETDFWQRTHYGFQADSGHFLGAEVAGDFCMTTQVRFHFVHQYDQAGLLVRASPDCWVKAGVEYERGGPAKLGAVATNLGYSDWSLQDFRGGRTRLRLRIRKRAADVMVEYGHAEGSTWNLIRVAHLHCEDLRSLQCGLYACSPKGAGFRAEFSHLRIERQGAGSD